ncbi:asparagine--tRNA ligase [archaeon]|jgi:asparaginyl-tRNA synthetase|nr:asparagine--tRNA ligase [archaeon]MBT6761640.1 asparagine--tRNA ligase [archaeon]
MVKTEYITVQDAITKGSGEVSLHGWVHRERGSKKLKFIVLRDSSEIIQCILKRDDFDEKTWDSIDKIQVEASVELTGTIAKDERAPTGYELKVSKFTLVGESHEFPIQKDASKEHLADHRHLHLRSRKMTAILKIRSTIFGAIDQYFRGVGFYEYHSPTLQAVQCEGGSDLFDVDYFGKKGVFLAQTWQLYAEPAVFALEKIYTIAPSFRAEKSKTSRHLTEYWHAEMEMAWSNFDDIIGHGEALLKHVVAAVLAKHNKELEILGRDPAKLQPTVDKPFVRMTYTEALKILKEKCDMEIEWGKDLRTIEEDKLSKLYDVPIICTHYPKKVKAFYMMEDPDDPRTVQGVDFIGTEGYGELIGGSHREHDIEKVKAALIEDGEDPSEYEFYLDTRRYGTVPHGGFGMGVERIISWICGLETIKDAIPFPRTMERYKP